MLQHLRLTITAGVTAIALASGCSEAATSPRADVSATVVPEVAASIVPGIAPVGEISAGGYHTCGLRTDGTVVCWGRNFSGESTPPPGLVAIQVAGGTFHACALRVDGTVTCWGDNSWGELNVPAGLVATHIGAGSYNTCAVKTDATVVCWGFNHHNISTPPPGLTSVAEIMPSLEHTCALKTDGSVVCWGNFYTSTNPPGLIAVQLTGIWNYACALRDSGTMACWGYAPYSGLVPTGIVVDQVTAGGGQTCALNTNATVSCWGLNDQGQANVPAGLSSVVQVSAGREHTCALKSDGSVTCWGAPSHGQTHVPAGLNLITTLPQSINVTSTAPDPAVVGSSYAITATGGASGNPVTFSSLTTDICEASGGGDVAFFSPGTCTIAADQAGSTNYYTAPQVTQSMTVIMGNSAPEAAAGGLYTAGEGSSIAFNGNGSSDADNDALTYAWTFGDGADGTGVAPTHTYADNGSYAVTLTVTDVHGASSSPASTTATITNVAPTITGLTVSTDPMPVGSTVALSAQYSDPSTVDTHMATVDWDDAAGAAAAAVNSSARTVSASRTFTQAGVYTVSLTVTDDDNGSVTREATGYIVVFDPSGGFVTGGGWIASPAGAYAIEPALTGKASFGFVSRYKNGASAPSGNTEFQFHAAGFTFSSSTYQWLVVAGATAKYKGTGTVNGSGNYGFMLSATDGQENGGGGIDKFRMKIWDLATGNVIYDNQAGSDDEADATTALGGGSIVIHK